MTLASIKERGRVVLPSLFTVANMGLGFFAILSANDGNFYRSALFLLVAIVMDMLDGKVARLVHGESEFGMEFDSLADFCTFGIAPACMMYQFVLKDYGGWGYPVAFLYALCAGLRLARFNLRAHAGTGSKDWFQGLPSPAAAGILASFVLLYTIMEQDRPVRTLSFLMHQMPSLYAAIPFVMLGIAYLMVSSLPYAAFKSPGRLRPRSLRGLLTAVMALALVWMYPQNAIFLFFTGYVLSGFVVLALRRVNHDPA